MTRQEAGFTIIEVIITMAIFASIILALLFIFDNFYKTYSVQQSLISVSGSARNAMEEIQNYALPANQVMVSYTFSGTVYNSGANVLVLQIPSIDSTGATITGKYDYVVFYATGSKLHRLALSDASSARAGGLKLLSDTLSGITFSYDNGTLSQATRVTIDIQTRALARRQTQQIHLIEQVYLRNH